MMNFLYNKLIRDNIPEKLLKLGKKYIVHKAVSDGEYWHKLKEKLQEEINEFGVKEDIESLVDVYETLDAIVAFKQFDVKEMRAMKENKAIEFGKFNKRFVLEQSDEEVGRANIQT